LKKFTCELRINKRNNWCTYYIYFPFIKLIFIFPILCVSLRCLFSWLNHSIESLLSVFKIKKCENKLLQNKLYSANRTNPKVLDQRTIY